MRVCGARWRWVDTFHLKCVHGFMARCFLIRIDIDHYHSNGMINVKTQQCEMQTAQSLISECITRIVYTVCVYLCLMLFLSSSLLLCFVAKVQSIPSRQTSIHRRSFKLMVGLQPWNCPWRMWVYKSDKCINEFNTRISLGNYCSQIFAMIQLMQPFQSHTY